jgi:hypothetical protein
MLPSRFRNYSDVKTKYQAEGSPWQEMIALADATAAKGIRRDPRQVVEGLYFSICPK